MKSGPVFSTQNSTQLTHSGVPPLGGNPGTERRNAGIFRQIQWLSVSAINDWLTCPCLWFGRRIGKWLDASDRGPMQIGIAIHHSLSAHHRGEDAESALVKCWRSTVVVPVRSTALSEALVAVQKYAAIVQPHKSDEPDKRIEFRVPGVPIPVIGYFDVRNRTYGFREFKSTSFPMSWTQEKVDSEFQATVYAMQCREDDKTRNPVVRYTILGLGAEPGIQEFTTRRTDNDYLRARATIRGVYQSMKQDELEAHCAPGKCPFPTECTKYGYKAPTPRNATGPVWSFSGGPVAVG